MAFSLHLFQRQYDQAEAFFVRALEIDQRNRGDNHPLVASHLDNRAELLVRQVMSYGVVVHVDMV